MDTEQALAIAETAEDLQTISAYKQAREDYETIPLIDGEVPEPFESNFHAAESAMHRLISRSSS